MKRFFVALLLLNPILCGAQSPSEPAREAALEIPYPSAPDSMFAEPPVVVATPVRPKAVPEAPSHVFFDRPAKIRFALLAGVIAADGITTQHVLNKDGGKEINPLARPLVVHGAAGQFAASAIGYAFGIGTSYVFHRTGHHKLERMFQNVAIGVEAECVANNLIQGAMTNRTAR
jgi:hypothetical protein